MTTIYLASPYGFTSAGVEYLAKIVPFLQEKNLTVLDPWRSLPEVAQKIKDIQRLPLESQNRHLGRLNDSVADQNTRDIDQSDVVVAVLDGTDVDSGVAAEIGYAFAQRKRIYGYRSDFRLAGDNSAALVNLQVEYFITRSGGAIFDTLENLGDALSGESGRPLPPPPAAP